jgi:hypothetical protein
VNTSYSATRAGLIVGSTRRRVQVCNGGSALIGGTPEVSTGAGTWPGSLSLPTGIIGTTLMPLPDGNVTMSWAIA